MQEPPNLPLILNGTFFTLKNFESENNTSRAEAVCNYCSKEFKAKLPSTNFLRHLKTNHPEEAKEYKKCSDEQKMKQKQIYFLTDFPPHY